MNSLGTVITIVALAVMFSLLAPTSAIPADDTKVKEGMSQVGDGVKETAKGVGTTVSEGAKYSGEKLKDAGQAAEAPTKSTWGHVRDGAVDAGRSVKSFFSNLFSN
jgi:hypothetical protein